eukprot:Blabericola_migrator_1__8549@NODE_446_length_8402_cov_75_646551_g349_i0_p7_GENE_NODE_446_length_8402_cov_75_646551_g349_i0NODE_446_length_8402_cov_75_646551_g349_i0_p7_ORF_typecomplete_len121_score8_61_NODE_446_length_8402_cov_75_646551_g349_i023562718
MHLTSTQYSPPHSYSRHGSHPGEEGALNFVVLTVVGSLHCAIVTLRDSVMLTLTTLFTALSAKIRLQKLRPDGDMSIQLSKSKILSCAALPRCVPVCLAGHKHNSPRSVASHSRISELLL